MNKQSSILDQLKQNRTSNVLKTANWSLLDFDDMLRTYSTAKEIAVESNDIDSIMILEEKISQLQEAITMYQTKLEGERSLCDSTDSQ